MSNENGMVAKVPENRVSAEMSGLTGGNVGAVSAVARERYELEGMLLTAKQWPRDEIRAGARIMEMCERGTFASEALYSFPRGGSTVSGPSVKLARQMSRVWGNITVGFRVVDIDDEWVHLQGYAYDLESNMKQTQEHRFRKRIQRKRGGETVWIDINDERELRELIGRHGSVLERNSILKLLPADIIEEAMEKCRQTMRKAAKGDLKKSRAETLRGFVATFAQIGVTQDMLEARLGHEIATVSEEELVDYRGIYKAISEGQATRDEYFAVKGRQKATVDVADIKAASEEAETEPEVVTVEEGGEG